MKRGLIRIEGEAYVTLETLAGCFDCEIEWVVEVYEFGLIGRGRRIDGTIALPAEALDRMASVYRWNRIEGLALESVAAIVVWED